MESRIKNLLSKTKKITPREIILVLVIFISGALTYGLVRFILIEKNDTHYHANFALYINGNKEEFNSFTYYEEVAACSRDLENNPKSRVHMHDNVNNIIHVHDKAVTWGDFFNNLGFTMADNLLVTPKGTYQTSDVNKFTYILNGEKINSIADKVINSEDSMLISYGQDDFAVNQKRYDYITKDANEYNKKSDPSTCAGGGVESFKDRLLRTLFK